MTTASLSATRYTSSGLSTAESILTERIVTMSASPLFKELSRSECRVIATWARDRVFARNEHLYMQGQLARNLTLIRSGSVKVSQLSPNGNEAILWMAGPGDPVGVLTEAVSQSYTCTAQAMEQCRTLVWDYAKLHELVAEVPQIRRNISQILAGRLDELQERFREVATEKVSPRVAKALLRLLKQVGKPNIGGVELFLSRDETAQMTGTTLFTISRLFSKWAEEGFILPRREGLIVLDIPRLERVSLMDA